MQSIVVTAADGPLASYASGLYQNYLATLISYLWSCVYVTYANDYIIGYECNVCMC